MDARATRIGLKLKPIPMSEAAIANSATLRTSWLVNEFC
jgi:hypothetical protein